MALIPARNLPHRVTLIWPGDAVDAYGDPTSDYAAGSRVEDEPARIWQTDASEVSDGRDAHISDWRMLTNNVEVTARTRVEWNDNTFEVVGPPALPSASADRAHHAAARLRLVTG